MRTVDWPPLVFFLVALGIASPVALRTDNHEFLFYIAVLVLIGGLVGLVHLRVGLHHLSLWALAVWAVLHLLGGLWHVSDDVGVLYNLWLIPERLKFDQLVHGYGFGTATWVAWQGLRHGLREPRPSVGLVFLAVCAGMGLGALNEVVEFFATLLVPETNVGGYVNTGWDLVSNLVGASLAGLAILVLGRAPQKSA